MTDVEQLDEFCDALWLEDGLARNSIESYRRDLNKFSVWQGQHGRSLNQTDHADVQAFMGHLHAQRARASSSARALTSLKRLFRYLLRQGKIAVDPTLLLDAPKLPRNLPRHLPKRMLRPCWERRTWQLRSVCATAPCWRCCMPVVCAFRNW